MIVFGCCASSLDKVATYVRPYVADRPFKCLLGSSSIARTYNSILDSYAFDWINHVDDIDAIVLLHDDLEVTDPDADAKFLAAFDDSNVAVVGVAGARTCSSLAWWDGDVVGHQLIDTGLIDFGVRSGDVTALEGSIIVMSRWAVANLRFDPTYTNFHGYDCDIAMTARKHGKRVRVVDVDTHHHTTLGFKSQESEESWQRADQTFRTKWHASR